MTPLHFSFLISKKKDDNAYFMGFLLLIRILQVKSVQTCCIQADIGAYTYSVCPAHGELSHVAARTLEEEKGLRRDKEGGK